jgi:soluble lytic murein transglycosylase-like protein
MNVDPQYLAAAKEQAGICAIDYKLVAAVCEQESSWLPFSIRYEPGFLAKYVAPIYNACKISATEAYARSFSWGLMQIMGQTARELGFTGESLAELCDPETGIEFGCRKLAACLKNAGGDQTKALPAYNGGSNPNYAAEVLARVKNYQ